MHARVTLLAMGAGAMGLALACASPTATPPPDVTSAPTGAQSPSATPPPSAPATALAPTASASAAPTPAPTVSPAPTGSPPPIVTEWSDPIRIGSVGYSHISLAIDASGTGHAAAATFSGDGVWYLTNASGEWVAEQVSTAPRRGADTQPSIAVDDTGSAWIVFARWDTWRCQLSCSGDPDGWHVTSNSAGQWSEPARLPDEVQSLDSTEDEVPLAARDGQPHAVFEVLGQIWYSTDAGDGWTAEQVSGNGHLPTIVVPPDGRARIAFGDQDGGASYAEAATTAGGYTTAPVPGTASCCEGWRAPNLTVDGMGEPVLLFGDGTATYMTRPNPDGWTAVDRAADEEYFVWGLIDSEGALHGLHDVYDSGASLDGLWYATNRHGAIETHRLHPRPPFADGSPEASSLSLDPAGRPHVLYVVLYGEAEQGLWHAIGPPSGGG